MKKLVALALCASVAFASEVCAQSKISPEQAKQFFKEGVNTVEEIERNWHKLMRPIKHDWYVIQYADGYCIFNRFKRIRTIDDVIDHSVGKGDCDWWPWPEGSNHVCLGTTNNAKRLIQKHGKITDILMIDHPTGNCGD